jgi:hypothetical protein
MKISLNRRVLTEWLTLQQEINEMMSFLLKALFPRVRFSTSGEQV